MEDSRRECLEKLLSQNFDQVSSICVITIAKYVVNILSNPNEPKYRTINMLNKAFQEKVLVCKVVQSDTLFLSYPILILFLQKHIIRKGSMDFMQCIGFRNDNAADSLHSSASAQFMVVNSPLIPLTPNRSYLYSLTDHFLLSYTLTV